MLPSGLLNIKPFAVTTIMIIVGLLAVPHLYNLLFPFPPPKLDNYFSKGDQYISKAEGITQTVLEQKGNKVYCELKFEPNAIGPLEHVHMNMDESGIVMKGTLSVTLDGQTNKFNAGERVLIRRGVYHTMKNDTSEEVVVRSETEQDFVPVSFAYSLAQLYPLMKPQGGLSLKMFAKLCVLDNLFDTVPSGPPPVVFRAIKKAVKPYARLFGVTPYDHRSKPD